MNRYPGLTFAICATATATACVAAAPPPTEQDVIAAFKARDWATLKAISSDKRVYVRPDGGAPEVIGWISRDQFLDRLRTCTAVLAFPSDKIHAKAGLEILCPNEPAGLKRCMVIAYGINFAIVGEKVEFDTVYRFSDSDRINCPSNAAPPPPAPPRR